MHQACTKDSQRTHKRFTKGLSKGFTKGLAKTIHKRILKWIHKVTHTRIHQRTSNRTHTCIHVVRTNKDGSFAPLLIAATGLQPHETNGT